MDPSPELKDELLSQLKSCREAFLFGHATMMVSYFGDWSCVVHEIFWFPRSDGNRENIPGDNVFQGVRTFQDCSKFHSELLKLLRRALLSEPCELVKHYCAITKQQKTLESSTLFQFARILRNSTSHKNGGTLCWDHNLTNKKGVTSLTWRYMQLNQADDGKELQLLDGDILLLHKDILDFVHSSLK